MDQSKDARLRALLERLMKRRSEEEAWSELYELMWPYVFGIMYRMLRGQRELAQDACQEVFFRLLRYARFERLQDPVAFRSYFARMAQNQALGYLARQGRLEFESDTDLESRGQHGGPKGTTAEEKLELEDLLEKALRPLAEGDRQLAGFLITGLSLTEIAQRLGISYENAAVRVHRLREKLRRHPLLADLLAKRE